MTTQQLPPDFLSPYSLDDFFSQYWEKNYLHIARNDRRYFDSVVTLPQLDQLITSVRIPVTNCNLARGDNPLPFDSYSQDASAVDKARVLALHEQGATIILRSIEQWSPSLNRLRIAAESLFGFAAQTNVYLTPPAEKSTPPHWDTHDLFILQVAGSKRWKLFEGQRTLPLDDERFEVGRDYAGPVTDEVVLRAGDTMYLPRGVIHEPVADTYSVHVSLGIHVLRYHDVFATALAMLSRQEGSPLRRALPPGLGATLIEGDGGVSGALGSADLLNQAADQLRRAFSQSRAVDLEGRVVDIAEGPMLTSDVVYSRRQGLPCAISEDEGAVRLRAGGQSVSVPRPLRTALNYVMANDNFTAAELPGSQSLDASLALCVSLVQVGVLKQSAAAKA